MGSATKTPTLLALAAVITIPPALALRSAQLERRLEAERDRARSLVDEVARLRGAVSSLERLKDAASHSGTEIPRLSGEVRRLQESLETEHRLLEGLVGGATRDDETAKEALRRIEGLGNELSALAERSARATADVAGLSVALEKESAARGSMERTLASRLERDPAAMARGMIGPTVQLSGEETVGSGVVIHARPSGAGAEVFAVTAYHVVRNIQGEGGDPAALRLLLYGGASPREVSGSLLAHDEETDLALLRFSVEGSAPEAARIVPRSRLATIPVFSPVYTVGCPLGNDPIPTAGEVASTKSVVGDATYWMINAPAYFGNSGGGVFLASSLELIGVYSKIYTHGRGRPTVISHMGLVTPADRVLDFLEKAGYGFVASDGAVAHAAAGPRSDS